MRFTDGMPVSLVMAESRRVNLHTMTVEGLGSQSQKASQVRIQSQTLLAARSGETLLRTLKGANAMLGIPGVAVPRFAGIPRVGFGSSVLVATHAGATAAALEGRTGARRLGILAGAALAMHGRRRNQFPHISAAAFRAGRSRFADLVHHGVGMRTGPALVVIRWHGCYLEKTGVSGSEVHQNGLSTASSTIPTKNSTGTSFIHR